MKKIFFNLCLGVGIIGLVSCSSSSGLDDDVYVFEDEQMIYPQVEYNTMFTSDPNMDAKVFNKRIPELNSLLVCRDKQCAPAELSTAKQYVFNALAHLVDNNADTTALLCEANPQAHVCVNPYLTIPAKVGVTPSYVYFDGVKLIDASQVKGKTALNLVLGYDLSYNGQTPYVCKPDKAVLYVKDNNNIVLNGNGFECDMTSMGTTNIRIMFSIDYIDMDYGYLGGYYSIGMSGPAYGGGSGYAMIRLPKDAHPLSPNLKSIDEKSEQKQSAQPVYRPEVKDELINAKEEEAQAEVKEEVENEKVQPLSYENEVVKNNDSVNAAQVIESGKSPAIEVRTDTSAYLNGGKTSSSQPYSVVKGKEALTIPESAVVTSKKVILKPEERSVSLVEVEAPVVEDEEIEEVYIDDLDDYIK